MGRGVKENDGVMTRVLPLENLSRNDGGTPGERCENGIAARGDPAGRGGADDKGKRAGDESLKAPENVAPLNPKGRKLVGVFIVVPTDREPGDGHPLL